MLTVLSVKELREAQQSGTVKSNQSTVDVKIDDKGSKQCLGKGCRKGNDSVMLPK